MRKAVYNRKLQFVSRTLAHPTHQTKYTVAARPGPGWLCHECVKASGVDPFKKPAAPRKRKAAQEKRKVVNFEEKERVQTLARLCIDVSLRTCLV